MSLYGVLVLVQFSSGQKQKFEIGDCKNCSTFVPVDVSGQMLEVEFMCMLHWFCTSKTNWHRVSRKLLCYDGAHWKTIDTQVRGSLCAIHNGLRALSNVEIVN